MTQIIRIRQCMDYTIFLTEKFEPEYRWPVPTPRKSLILHSFAAVAADCPLGDWKWQIKMVKYIFVLYQSANWCPFLCLQIYKPPLIWEILDPSLAGKNNLLFRKVSQNKTQQLKYPTSVAGKNCFNISILLINFCYLFFEKKLVWS